jgi:MFS family permease
MDERHDERDRVRRQAEEALLEPPLPHSAAPPPRLLANRPFIWLVASYGVSQLGFWAFFLAILGQAGFEYHAGAFQLGILFSSFSISFLLLTAPLGQVCDRWSPKWMIVLAQVVSMVSVVPAMVGGSMKWLYAASVIDGVGAAAAIPARGSLTALLVETGDLVRANGTMNTGSMFAVIFGPVVSGYLVRDFGHRAAYWFILAVIGAGLLLLFPIEDRRPRGISENSFARDMTDGFRLSWRHRELRALLLLAGAAWFLITVLITLEPLFVKQVLHRHIDSLGILWSAHGVGAFLGAVAVTRMKRAGGREVFWLGLALLIGSAGLLIYVGTPLFGVAIVGNAVFGVSFAWFVSLSQALIQRVTAEDMRGRVTGVVGMLQESSSLACALGISALAGIIATVQPYLIGSALAMSVFGFYGVRVGRELGRARTVTPAPALAQRDGG